LVRTSEESPLSEIVLEEATAAALVVNIFEQAEQEACRADPAYLLERVKCIDATTGETFQFHLLDETAGWYWQRAVLDHWMSSEKSIVLKARQLGITWLAAGLGLWTVLFKPGSRVLVISINEEEASKVVNRLWDMLESLPPHLRMGVEILKPSRGTRPNLHIELKHPDGRISSVIGLPSTKKAGHGETAALVILDEYARHEYARESWKAVLPTMSHGGKILAISTGNGVSNALTGEGNFFHHLWVNAEQYDIAQHFLRWDLHPDRDEEWYARIAMGMPATDRAEQFPKTELEAFILTGTPYFDMDSLVWYSQNALAEPLYRMRFDKASFDHARIVKSEQGWIRVFREPEENHQYALAADVATGRGADYSSAHVIDLGDMGICAHFHGKIDADLYAFQLHYLARFFNTAWLAVEMGGGYGEPIVLALRDGREGRPAYPRLYRHRQLDRGDQPEAKPFGFPMNLKTRPTVIEGLEEALRERLFPSLDSELLSELQTFVYRTTTPSPRAQEGCNDDRVMSLGIALELYRQRGHHPGRELRRARRVRRTPQSAYPWQRA
jgi:hypothetical protein